MTTAELVKLREATNAAIKTATKARADIHGAINWDELACACASWVLSDDGAYHAEVTVEEADPAAFELRAVIRVELIRMGYDNVRVVTEW